MTGKIEQQNQEIVALLDKHLEGLTIGQIIENISFNVSRKTLQRRLAMLIDDGRIQRIGERKASRYYPPGDAFASLKDINKDKVAHIFSPKSQKILSFLQVSPHQREKVTYNRDFLESYVPNKSVYVPKDIRNELLTLGKRSDEELAAGTYARQICQRLLIDLSYNSSRLEGNTYSRLDTQKLVEQGLSAEGKVHEETVMIMNHKEAILFLVENAQHIALDSLTIRNLHQLLSQDLLGNPYACGNIRTITVDIGLSAYKPLENTHVLRELFELILQKAKHIDDPFEQSFFLLIHLSYLQAFEDVNKRTSRLSCNIPFIKSNLCPLSFTDVARDDYTAALLAIYEKNNTQPMLELFAWAYSRSCQQYGLVKKSLGEIDAFRIQYRQQRKDVMGQVVRQGLHGEAAQNHIEAFCEKQSIADLDKFTAMTLADLATLHAGAIIGLGITESQFEAWLSNKPK